MLLITSWVPEDVPHVFMCCLAWLRLLYLVERVFVGHLLDVQLQFQLSKRPHARPTVLLSHRHQQRGDRVVELRDGDRIPGPQEHDVCSNTSRQQDRMREVRTFKTK